MSTVPRGRLPWDSGRWRNEPVAAVVDGCFLRVTAAAASDAWRHTSYGFVHDSAHALLLSFAEGTAVEVSFLLDYGEQFDQAGIYLHTDAENWVKAGVEVSDGVPQVGAVVTRSLSDWSVAPVSGWAGREVTVRMSRAGNALTARARARGRDEAFRLVRVVPLPSDTDVLAGPYCCSPTRSGFTATFTRWAVTRADDSPHP